MKLPISIVTLLLMMNQMKFIQAYIQLSATPEWMPQVDSLKQWLKEKVPGLEKDFEDEDEYADKLEQIITVISGNDTVNDWIEEEEEIYDLELFSPHFYRRAATARAVPPFHCELKPSLEAISEGSTLPTSVHKLRPRDIRVIGAMGDSLTSGTGILAKTIFGILLQDHGFSFSIGGHHEYETAATLPNIIKKYNRNLKGHSTGKGLLHARATYLNVAAPGSKSKDMLEQAEILVKRMRNLKGIDFQNDWKVVTIFVGANDLCNYCFNKREYSPQKYKENLMRAIDYLYDNLPKTFINLLEVVDVSLAYELQNSGRICNLLQSTYLCRCAANAHTPQQMTEVRNYIQYYQHEVRGIARDPKYDGRTDFTIVSQPMFRHAAPPRLPGGKLDTSLLAPDCFHFNRRGHALAALGLWRNMFEPVGNKTVNFFTNPLLHCPIDGSHYFRTKLNSL